MNQLLESYDNLDDHTTFYYYDELGNLTSDGNGQYDYDYRNRLIYCSGNGIARYTYYIDGLRKSKRINNNTTYFIWLDGNMVYEFSDYNSYTYIYGHRLLYSNNSTYVLNAHGDVVALVQEDVEHIFWIPDEDGNTQEQIFYIDTLYETYEYDAFGNELDPSTYDSNPFRYCAEYFDVESGQIYLRARYYQPTVGRFSQRDTHWNTANMIYGDEVKTKEYIDYLGLNTYTVKLVDYAVVRQSGNLYLYCLNNPIFYMDATGENAGAVLAGSWGIAGGLALSDGFLPFGDLAGVVVGVGGTLIAGGMALKNWCDSISKDEVKEVGKEITISTPKPKVQPIFTADPNEFSPVGLVKVEHLGTKNGRIIQWKDPSTKLIVFRWDENTGYDNGPHYHIEPMAENIHFYAGMAVPEPYATEYFPK